MTAFELPPTTTDFSVDNALALARAARLAYKGPEKVGHTLQEWGFELIEFFDSEGTQAFIAGSEDATLLSFRGTEEPADFITDVDMRLVAEDPGRTHRGFHEGLDRVWSEVLTRVREQPASRPLWLTGHSLGAGLATIAAARLALDEQLVPQGVYTIGSPRVGDRAFAGAYDRALKRRTFRFVNNNDVVTRFPHGFRHARYVHVGSERIIDAQGQLHESMSPWRRLLDRVWGRLDDIGEPGSDGLNDHGSERYIERLERIANG